MSFNCWQAKTIALSLADRLSQYSHWTQVSKLKNELKKIFQENRSDVQPEQVYPLIEEITVQYYLLFEEILTAKHFEDVIVLYEQAGNYYANLEAHRVEFDDEEISTFYEFLQKELAAYPDFSHGLNTLIAVNQQHVSLFKKSFSETLKHLEKAQPKLAELWKAKFDEYLKASQENLDPLRLLFVNGMQDVSKILTPQFYLPPLKRKSIENYYSPQELITIGLEKKLVFGGWSEKQLRGLQNKTEFSKEELKRFPKIQKGVDIGAGCKFFGEVVIQGENIVLGEKNIFEEVMISGRNLEFGSHNSIKSFGLYLDGFKMADRNFVSKVVLYSPRNIQTGISYIGSYNRIEMTQWIVDNALGMFVGDHNAIGNRYSKNIFQAIGETILIGFENQIGLTQGVDLNAKYEDRKIVPADFNLGDKNELICQLLQQKGYLSEDGYFEDKLYRGVTHEEFFKDLENQFSIKVTQEIFEQVHALMKPSCGVW